MTRNFADDEQSRYVMGERCQIAGLAEIYAGHFGYKEDGYFVEVGAFDGLKWSNTSGLLKAGWTGVYFEPQTEIYAKLRKNLAGYPQAFFVNKALSDYFGDTRLYLGGSISTIDKDTRDAYLEIGGFNSTGLASGEYEKVTVSTLDIELMILNAPQEFELLVIDAEGSEPAILRGFSIWEWKPQMVIIEAHEQFEDERLQKKAKAINAYMYYWGYKAVYSDEINNIYVPK